MLDLCLWCGRLQVFYCPVSGGKEEGAKREGKGMKLTRPVQDTDHLRRLARAVESPSHAREGCAEVDRNDDAIISATAQTWCHIEDDTPLS